MIYRAFEGVKWGIEEGLDKGWDEIRAGIYWYLYARIFLLYGII